MTREVILVGGVCLLCIAWVARKKRLPERRAQVVAARAQVARALRPRTPEDCPECQAASQGAEEGNTVRPVVRPWSEVKSRRGRKKGLDTAGHACWNRACVYYGITDAKVHALTGYGGHGRSDRIQDLWCAACKMKVTERRGTALYRLKTSAQRVGEVLTALAEGLDVSAAVRVFQHGEGTIRRWLTRAGLHAEQVQAHFFHGLSLGHVQLDELKTKVRQSSDEVWVWLGVEAHTKLIPVIQVGPRTQDVAYAVVHALVMVLAPGCIPVFTSDGLDLYFYALTAHFGAWRDQLGERTRHWEVSAELMYGQLKKVYRRRKLERTEHRMRCGTLEALKERLKGLGGSGVLNTAFVERVNLTVRQSVSELIRRTWGVAQTLDGLTLHLEWWRGYYHFVRPHESLRVKLGAPVERGGRRISQRYRQRTPAMAAGITHHRWSVGELLGYPVPPQAVCA